jgi:hypothetical protein
VIIAARSIALSRNGAHALVLTTDGTALILGVHATHTADRVLLHDPGARLTAAAIGPDSTSIFFCKDDTIAVTGDLTAMPVPLLTQSACPGILIAGAPVAPDRATLVVDNAPLDLHARPSGPEFTPWITDGTGVRAVDDAVRPGGSGPGLFGSGFSWLRIDAPGAAPQVFDTFPEDTPDNENGLFAWSPNGRARLNLWDDIRVFDSKSGAVVQALPYSVAARCGVVADDIEMIVLGQHAGQLLTLNLSSGDTSRHQLAAAGLSDVALDASGQVALWRDSRGLFGALNLQEGTDLLPDLVNRLSVLMTALV